MVIVNSVTGRLIVARAGNGYSPAHPLIVAFILGFSESPVVAVSLIVRRFARGVGVVMAASTLLAACGLDVKNDPVPDTSRRGEMLERTGSILGPGGINFGGNNAPSQGDGSGLGVNAFLWRASLDTVSVWPVQSADPYGGVIITDWYAPPQTPSERFKLNVYIIDRALRADGVRVAVFRQVRGGGGDWQDAQVQPETATKLEDAILMRARQMRNQTASGQ